MYLDFLDLQIPTRNVNYFPNTLEYLDLALENQMIDGNDDDMASASTFVSDYQCRVCLEDIDPDYDDDIVSPCNCRGTAAYIHIECFNKMRIDRCPTCNFQIRLIDSNVMRRLKNGQHALARLANEMGELMDELKSPPDEVLHCPWENLRRHENFHVEPLEPPGPIFPQLVVQEDLGDIFERGPIFPHPNRPFAHMLNVVNNVQHPDIFTILTNLEPMFPILYPGVVVPPLTPLITKTRNYWLNIEIVRLCYFAYLFVDALLENNNLFRSTLVYIAFFSSVVCAISLATIGRGIAIVWKRLKTMTTV